MDGSSDYELDWVRSCYYTQDVCCHPELDDCSKCPEKRKVVEDVDGMATDTPKIKGYEVRSKFASHPKGLCSLTVGVRITNLKWEWGYL